MNCSRLADFNKPAFYGGLSIDLKKDGVIGKVFHLYKRGFQLQLQNISQICTIFSNVMNNLENQMECRRKLKRPIMLVMEYSSLSKTPGVKPGRLGSL